MVSLVFSPAVLNEWDPGLQFRQVVESSGNGGFEGRGIKWLAMPDPDNREPFINRRVRYNAVGRLQAMITQRGPVRKVAIRRCGGLYPRQGPVSCATWGGEMAAVVVAQSLPEVDG